MSETHFRYDDYAVDPHAQPLHQADAVMENVFALYKGDQISGFTKIVTPAEIARLHEEKVIGYDPNQQRGFRVKWNEGQVTDQRYLIMPEKVKQIAQTIAEDRHHNRTRHANARFGHVGLYFEPVTKLSDRREIGRLYIFRKEDTPFNGLDALLTTPDSAHRQKGDIHFTEKLAGPKGVFNPEVAGFSPDSYDLVLEISLTDEQGEGLAHYEHNELITKSSASRRNYLEQGVRDHANWVAHEMMRMNTVTRDLVEIYEKSISANSPKIVTFSTLHQALDEGWGDMLTAGTRGEVAQQLDEALKVARSEVREWQPLGFDERKRERAQTLHTQAIVFRAMFRLFYDWHMKNVADGRAGDWERWRNNMRRLKEEQDFTAGGIIERCLFLSRRNPIFYAEPGGGIYTMKKAALERKDKAEADGETYVVDPLEDLTVQNVKGSIEFMYQRLRSFLGVEPAAAVAIRAA